jgi:hypothetical protein
VFGESKLVNDLRTQISELHFVLTTERLEKDERVGKMQREIDLLTRERDEWREIACLTLNDLLKLCLESELWKKIHQPKPREKQAKLKSLLAEADRLLGKGGGK